jgi:predicted KAP-like P-loop ATPase
MAIRLQPGQGRGEKDNDNKNNNQNYEGNNVTQSTKAITTIKPAPQDSASNKKIKIIIDEPAKEGALDFQDYSRSLANIIRETTIPQFAVGIFGKWGSGKTTLMKMIKEELDKDKDKMLTVWFDAWRYEREKHVAVIPFLRQIRIALDNDLAKKENRKPQNWKKVRRGVDKTLTAFIESFGPSISPAGSPVSATFNPEKFVNSLKSKGSTWIHNERIQFQEHITDYLKEALYNFIEENPGSRIVVFVDDLDRCTPEKARKDGITNDDDMDDKTWNRYSVNIFDEIILVDD